MADSSKDIMKALSNSPQSEPTGTIFDDDVFTAACNKLVGKNKAKVIRHPPPLIVPLAEILALYDNDLKILVESVNDSWDYPIPFTRTRP